MSFSGCGFLGSYTFSNNHPNLSRVIFKKMLTAMAHRGPDAEGIWQEDQILLGHRRLSILDLSAKGSQPMTREHLTISFNGEVYNFEAIRSDLIELGYSFVSDTDTEVILRAYQEWNIAALSKFEGMFAFAIWDSEKKELLLARDQIGIKPLYYFQNEDYLLFGSEIQALMYSEQIPNEIDYEQLAIEVHLGSLFNYKHAKNLVKDVNSIQPGEWMLVKSNGEITKQKYYQITTKKGATESTDLLVNQLNELLKKSIKAHLISDVPVAAFLSGGIDSSLINAIACTEQSQSKLTAITITYKGGSKDPYTHQENDDLYYSKILADQFPTKIDHKILEIESTNLSLEKLDAIIDLASLTDDDRLLTIYANYQSVKKQGIKVVLNGQGADEMMGGYIAYLKNFTDESLTIRERLQLLVNARCQLRIEIMNPVFAAKKEAVFNNFESNFNTYSGNEIEQYHRMMMDSQLQRILKFEDYLSMQHSIECRVPFITPQLVDWSFSTSFDQHIRFTEPVMGKILLRKVADSFLPQILVNRPKQVFPSADNTLFHNILLEILLENKNEIRESEAVYTVFNVELFINEPRILNYKELWLLIALWRWEVKLKKQF